MRPVAAGAEQEVEADTDSSRLLRRDGAVAASARELFQSPVECSAAIERRRRRRHVLMGASAGAGALACALVVWSAKVGSRELVSGAADAESKIAVVSKSPLHIAWAAHPHMCWDVKGTVAGKGKTLQIMKCSAGGDTFILPEGKTGQIRWSQNTDFCLNAPGNPPAQLQLWHCNDKHVNKKHMQWELKKSPDGRTVRVASEGQKGYCVDVPNRQVQSGKRLQLWKCERHGLLVHMQFKLIDPSLMVDCKYGHWSKWSICSKACGGGKRGRTRDVVAPHPAPKVCQNASLQESPCNAKKCDSIPTAEDIFIQFAGEGASKMRLAKAKVALKATFAKDMEAKKLAALVANSDVDKDGKLSSDEFRSLYEETRKELDQLGWDEGEKLKTEEEKRRSDSPGLRGRAQDAVLALCTLCAVGRLLRW